MTLLVFAKSRGGSYLIAPYAWSVTCEDLLIGMSYCLVAIGSGRCIAILLASRCSVSIVTACTAIALALASTIVWPAPFIASDDDVVKYVRGYWAPMLFLSTPAVFAISFVLPFPTRNRLVNLSDSQEYTSSFESDSRVLRYGREDHSGQRLIYFLAAGISGSAAIGSSLRFARGRGLIPGLPSDVVINTQMFFLLSVPLVLLGTILFTSTQANSVLRLTLLTCTLLASLTVAIIF